MPLSPLSFTTGQLRPIPAPREFQQILQGLEGKIRERLGPYILNFKCFLLNIHDLKLEEDKNLTLGPIIYIMQNIFGLSEEVVEKLFAQGDNLSEKERIDQIIIAVRYIQRVDPKFTWKVIKDISSKAQKEAGKQEGDKAMIRFDQTIDECLEERFEEGLEKGLEKGRKEMALKLLAVKMDRNLISQVTGLSEKEIKALEKQDNKEL